MEFAKGGRFWHLFTDGSSMEDIFLNEDDMKTGMIALAMGRCIYQEIEIITFELMSNHLHLILRGDRGACLELFGYFKKKLARIFCKQDRCIDWKRFKADILEIPDLKALRNEIIYVNRNAFVADPRFTPFSYPWGGGKDVRERQELFHDIDTKLRRNEFDSCKTERQYLPYR